ncbi:MAG: hypothetical protein JWQ96_1917 [Segetibacter sp.]|nr:hypothetical protein [Segetibacter sp.]
MVYTDGVHLTADSLDELYGYANKLGLNTNWLHFMGRNIHPHFDICGNVKRRVLGDKSVKKVTCKEIVKLSMLNYRLPETDNEVKEWEAYHNKSVSDIPMPSKSDYDRMFDNIYKRCGVKGS